MGGAPPALVVRPLRTAVWLGAVALLLIFASVGTSLLELARPDLGWLSEIFQLSRERNIPSFYSGLLLALDAGLLAVVWRVWRLEGRGGRGWLALGGVFLFLSFDELFSVHEKLIDPLRSTLNATGVLYYTWVVVYGAAVVVVAVLFFPLWRALDAHLRWWMALAAVSYVTGAIGFEMVSGARYEVAGGKTDILYGILYTSEESLELAGLVVFTYALLSLLARSRVLVAMFDDVDEHGTEASPAETGPHDRAI